MTDDGNGNGELKLETKWGSFSVPARGLVILSIVASAAFGIITYQLVETLRSARAQHDILNDRIIAVLESLGDCDRTRPGPLPRQGTVPGLQQHVIPPLR